MILCPPYTVRTCLKRLVKLLMLDLLRIRMMAVSEAFGHVEFATSEDAQKVCASVFAYGERSIVLKLSC